MLLISCGRHGLIIKVSMLFVHVGYPSTGLAFEKK